MAANSCVLLAGGSRAWLVRVQAIIAMILVETLLLHLHSSSYQ